MDKQYELYCLANRFFYDSPDRRGSAGVEFGFTSQQLPTGWHRSIIKDEWIVCVPPDDSTPPQGWKIHVSACLDNAEEVLAVVWAYCLDRRICFKFLRSELALLIRNAKYAPRGGSGKFVTIYPADEAQLQLVLSDLSRMLDGQQGPYILTDLRYGKGPLYVRYGGFAKRYCQDDKGDLVTAIEDAAGRLVPDRRNPVFSVPDWVTLPGFLAPHLAARNAATIAGLPYRIETALHFSNGGGVYSAVDLRGGGKVIIKEARPHAGLAADRADAVARLQRERDMLRRLSGLPAVPGIRDYFERDGHHFLVQEFIEGTPLQTCFARRLPLIDPEPEPAEVAAYTAWALRVCASVEDAVAQIHRRGVIFNDLHMFNILVRPDDSAALIDFEVAARAEEGRRPTLGNAGFVAPPDRAGFGIDRYSLACLRLAMFLPITVLFPLDRGKAAHFADVIAEHFPVERAFLDKAVSEIVQTAVDGDSGAGRPGRNKPLAYSATPPGGRPAAGHSGLSGIVEDLLDWERARPSMARAILASATPDRDDRLFPGDIRQFAGEGLGIAHGAAGVLYALSATGAGRFPEHEEWLISHATAPAPSTMLGLYDGLLGAACVLAQLGHAEAAVKVARICLSERWERLGPSLYGGLAGFAVGLLHLGDVTGEPAVLDAALRAAEMVAGWVERPHGDEGPSRAGLMHGAAGPALVCVRMYERTGDPGYLDAAAAALGRDLGACVTARTGALHVDEGWRTMPYLGAGSAGIGLVLEEYLRHRADDRFAAAIPPIRRAALSPFYAQSGLLAGRAGMILYLSRRPAPHDAGPAAGDPHIAAQIRRLAWHAIRYAGGLAFPGEQLLRLSMDLATGTAGVLLAVGTAFNADSAGLPFLAPVSLRHPSQQIPTSVA